MEKDISDKDRQLRRFADFSRCQETFSDQRRLLQTHKCVFRHSANSVACFGHDDLFCSDNADIQRRFPTCTDVFGCLKTFSDMNRLSADI